MKYALLIGIGGILFAVGWIVIGTRPSAPTNGQPVADASGAKPRPIEAPGHHQRDAGSDVASDRRPSNLPDLNSDVADGGGEMSDDNGEGVGPTDPAPRPAGERVRVGDWAARLARSGAPGAGTLGRLPIGVQAELAAHTITAGAEDKWVMMALIDAPSVDPAVVLAAMEHTVDVGVRTLGWHWFARRRAPGAAERLAGLLPEPESQAFPNRPTPAVLDAIRWNPSPAAIDWLLRVGDLDCDERTRRGEDVTITSELVDVLAFVTGIAPDPEADGPAMLSGFRADLDGHPERMVGVRVDDDGALHFPTPNARMRATIDRFAARLMETGGALDRDEREALAASSLAAGQMLVSFLADHPPTGRTFAARTDETVADLQVLAGWPLPELAPMLAEAGTAILARATGDPITTAARPVTLCLLEHFRTVGSPARLPVVRAWLSSVVETCVTRRWDLVIPPATVFACIERVDDPGLVAPLLDVPREYHNDNWARCLCSLTRHEFGSDAANRDVARWRQWLAGG